MDKLKKSKQVWEYINPQLTMYDGLLGDDKILSKLCLRFDELDITFHKDNFFELLDMADEIIRLLGIWYSDEVVAFLSEKRSEEEDEEDQCLQPFSEK